MHTVADSEIELLGGTILTKEKQERSSVYLSRERGQMVMDYSHPPLACALWHLSNMTSSNIQFR